MYYMKTMDVCCGSMKAMCGEESLVVLLSSGF